MNATSRSQHGTPQAGKTPLPTPRRFIHCIACQTWKKERSYALCAECYRANGLLSPAEFRCLARRASREEPQYSYRLHPEFGRACRVYARRWARTTAMAVIDAALPRLNRNGDAHGPGQLDEEYDGIGSYDLADLLDWQIRGLPLPELERSEHQEASDEEIARWDARVEAWVAAQGGSLQDSEVAELRPWGYAIFVDGAMVWTDDLVFE